MTQTKLDRLWDETGTLARDSAFDEIAARFNAMALVDRSYARQAAGKLFRRIVNNYPPFRGDAKATQEWQEWVQRSSVWRSTFARSAFDAASLERAVDAALADFRAHRAESREALRRLASECADVLDTVMVRPENAPTAYSRLIHLRDEWLAQGSTSSASTLISNALAVVRMVKATADEFGEADPWLQQVSELKQQLRTIATSGMPIRP